MPSPFEWALGALAVYWFAVLWRRWNTHVRTQRFVLEQRRKAGIPDWDHRPMAEAAADAQRRRQEALADQLRQAEDIFRVPQQQNTQLQPSTTARRRRAEAETVHYNLPAAMPLAPTPVAPAPSPVVRMSSPAPARVKRGHEDSEEPVAKRERLERRESRKRHADDAEDRRVRRRVTVVVPDEEASTSDPEDMSDEDIGSEELSDESMEPSESSPSTAPVSRKRSVDTSDDRQPGDEWEDANGLRWRIGEDGVPRRAVMVVEMRPKYRMPRDAQHPDALLKVPTYTEKYLSHDEYEEAKRKKVLSWQYERARAAAATTVLPEADDSVEDSLASLVSRRNRKRPGLLFESPRKRSDGDDSMASVPGLDDSLSFSSIGAVDRSPAIGTSRRLRLSRRTASPAPGGLLAQRYAQVYSSSPARTALDEESKRRREEALMAKIREERKNAPAAQPAPSVSVTSAAPAAPNGPPAGPSDSKPVFSFGK